MATAINSARADEIKLETNIPQTFALKFSTGKPVGNWGNTMFTAVDSRRLFLNAEDAGEFEHALLDLRVQPAEFIRVTRVHHGGRGGGFSIRVERVEDVPETDARLIARLERSVALAREKSGSPAAPDRAPEPEKLHQQVQQVNSSAAAGLVVTPASAAMCAAMRSAVDAILETQAYATKRGLGLTFSEESVRAIGLSIYIGQQQAAR